MLILDEPLIYTSKGNVPINSLRYEKHWQVTDAMITFVQEWYDGDELVKNEVHLYALKGLPPIGAVQAQM